MLEKWETERLEVIDSNLKDANEIQEICEKSDYLRKWEGNALINPHHIKNTIIEGDLPPGGVKEHFKIQHFRLKTNQNLVGYMTYYFGYP